MAEPGTIRKGPKLTDIAVAMASGWIHLRDGRRLTEEQITGWVELRAPDEARYVIATPEPSTGLRDEIAAVCRIAESYTTLDVDRIPLGELAQMIESGAYAAGQAAGEQGQPDPAQLKPLEIRLAMLVAWEKHVTLTIADAARISGVANLPNYTSRFATNMIRDGWIRAVVHNGEVLKQGHSKVFEITETGLAQLGPKEDA